VFLCKRVKWRIKKNFPWFTAQCDDVIRRTMKFSMPWIKVLTWQVACCVEILHWSGRVECYSFFWVSLLLILADISPIFTFCSGQFIIFIYLSKMLYAMLSIGVKVKAHSIRWIRQERTPWTAKLPLHRLTLELGGLFKLVKTLSPMLLL